MLCRHGGLGSFAGFAPKDKRLGPIASNMLMNDNVEIAEYVENMSAAKYKCVILFQLAYRYLPNMLAAFWSHEYQMPLVTYVQSSDNWTSVVS